MPNKEEAPKLFRLWLANRSLKSVYRSLDEFDLNNVSVEPTNTARGFRHISIDRQFGRIGVVPLIDSMAVVYTSNAWLENRSHKFIFLDNQENVVYYRESFNVDIQKIPGPSVEREGIEAIALDTDAFLELRFVNSALKQAIKNGGLEEAPRGTLTYPSYGYA